MNYRKAIYNGEGGINLEYQHPDHGWIPYTVGPHDEGDRLKLYELIEKTGDVAPVKLPTLEQKRAVATLTRAEFALKAAAAGHVTPAEARAWAAQQALPVSCNPA